MLRGHPGGHLIRELMRDGAIYALSAIASRGLSFLLVPLYTRLLAPAEYGALDLIVTFGLLVNLVVALEVGQGMARDWAEEPEAMARRQLASTALLFTLLVHAAFLIVALFAAGSLAKGLLGSSDLEPVMRAGLLFIALNAVFLQLQSQFRWELRPRAYAVVSMLYAGLTLILGAVLEKWGGLQGVLWGQAAAAAVASLTSLVLLRRSLELTFDCKKLARMLRFSLPLMPAGLAIFCSFYVNRLMLNALSSLDEVAVFGVASRIAGLTTLLIVGFQGALTPLIYVHYREQGVPRQLARILEVFVAAALVACLAFSVYAREILSWITTPDYAASAVLLPWLAPAALMTQMYIFLPGIAIERRTGWQLMLTSFSAVVSIGLNALLIPRWGALGAAVATCAAAIVFLVLWLRASQRLYSLPLRMRAVVSAIVTYGVCIALDLLLERSPWNAEVLLVLKALLVALLLGATLFVGLVRRADLARWGSMLTRSSFREQPAAIEEPAKEHTACHHLRSDR